MKYFLGRHDLNIPARGLPDCNNLTDSTALLMRMKSRSTSGRINISRTSSTLKDDEITADVEKMKYSVLPFDDVEKNKEDYLEDWRTKVDGGAGEGVDDRRISRGLLIGCRSASMVLSGRCRSKDDMLETLSAANTRPQTPRSRKTGLISRAHSHTSRNHLLV